jgi:hypothetical protein
MSPYICKIFLSKLFERYKKEGGGIVQVRKEGRRTTHEDKMTNATYVSLKKRKSLICATF